VDKFQTVKLNNEPYDFLIIAASYENPLDLDDEVDQAIKVEKAKLLFDLTLLNGFHDNRYIACDYERGNFASTSYTITFDVSERIKTISNNFFKQHVDVVQDSVIPDALKFLLTKTDLVK
jgi:hypothetical protein